MHTLRVELGANSYEVLAGSDLIHQAGTLTREVLDIRRWCVLADATVAGLYGATVVKSFADAGLRADLVTFPAGEKSKSLPQAEQLCNEMIALGHDRSSGIVALGGGVTGDLAGFVAAIYYRGIPFVQIPTTVVAQVDSSIGGKTGVNAGAGKNLIGSFHQPRLVLADTGTLRSLSPREFNEGFAEVIKHAIIRDAALMDRIMNLKMGQADSDETLADIIATNVQIKARIVEADVEERAGLRALLNFGHTIGHGIEAAGGYGRFLHGEAIALGIVAAARLSRLFAGLSSGDYAKILAALEKFELPIILPADVDPEAVLAALGRDKKFVEGKPRLVLTKRIGEAHLTDEVGTDAIRSAIFSLQNRDSDAIAG